MQVRIRLGAGLSRLVGKPLVIVDLPDGATVDEALRRVAASEPALPPNLTGVLTVIDGRQVGRSHHLSDSTEIALLLPAAGG